MSLSYKTMFTRAFKTKKPGQIGRAKGLYSKAPNDRRVLISTEY